VIQNQITRRRLLAVGTTAAVGAAGIALGTDRAVASASVDMGTFDATGGEFSPADGEAYAIHAFVSGQYAYKVNTDPEDWQAYLLVGSGDGDTEAIGIIDGPATAREGSGTYALRGPITAASFYSSGDFRVPDGQHSVTRTIPLTVVFLVRDAAGETLVQARESADLPVTIDDDGMPRVAISASAQAAMQDDAVDDTPTLPGGN